MIERGGIVIDYDKEDQTITDRLNEAELRVESNLNELEDDGEVEKIIQAVSDEVKKYCNN